MRDFYQILGVARTADQETLRRAYRKLARQYHPDLNPSAAEQFKEITAAYDVLGDADRRRLYDEFGDVCLKPGFDPVVARHAGLGNGPRPGSRNSSHNDAFTEFFQHLNSPSAAGTTPYRGSAQEADEEEVESSPEDNPFGWGGFSGSTSGTTPYRGSAGERPDPSHFQGSSSGTTPYRGSAQEEPDPSFFQGTTSGTTPYRGSAQEAGVPNGFSRSSRPNTYYPGKNYGDGGQSRSSSHTQQSADPYRQRMTASRGNAPYRAPGASTAQARATPQEQPYRSAQPAPVSGTDIFHSMEIGLLESLQGTSRELFIQRTLHNGQVQDEGLRVSIRAGVESGEQVRLQGRGNPGRHGGRAGDLILTIEVRPSPHFRREGHDLYLEVPITLQEALLGGKIEVPTPDGIVRVQVPRNSTQGRRLRLKRRGVSVGNGDRGDLYLILRPTPPDADTPEVRRLLAELEKHYPPRGIRSDMEL